MSRQINLYDASLRRRKDWLTGDNLVLVTLLALLLVALGAGMTRWTLASRAQAAASVNTQLVAARAAFAAMTASFSARQADPALVAEVATSEREVQAARSAIELLHGMTSAQAAPVVGEMMDAFSRSAVDGLWLTGFVVSEGGKQLEIRGRLKDQALLPPYLHRLESEPVFRGRRFASLDMRGAAWVPPVRPEVGAPAGSAAGSTVLAPPEHWYVEFALRSTDIPKTVAEAGGGR